MSGSTIVAVKKALKANLSALPALSGTQFQYADETDTARRTRFYFGAHIDENDQEPVALRAGRRRREENYHLHLHLDAMLAPTAEDNETAALALIQVVEEYLADNPTIGGVTGVVFAVVDGFDLTTLLTPEGAITRVDLRIRVKARLL